MKTLAEKFAEKYNALKTDAERIFAFNLEMKAESSNNWKGFKFEDESRVEFLPSAWVKNGVVMIAFKN